MNERQFANNYSLLEIINNIDYESLASIEIYGFSRVSYIGLVELTDGQLAIVRLSKYDRLLLQRHDGIVLDRIFTEVLDQVARKSVQKLTLVDSIKRKLAALVK